MQCERCEAPDAADLFGEVALCEACHITIIRYWLQNVTAFEESLGGEAANSYFIEQFIIYLQEKLQALRAEKLVN